MHQSCVGERVRICKEGIREYYEESLLPLCNTDLLNMTNVYTVCSGTCEHLQGADPRMAFSPHPLPGRFPHLHSRGDEAERRPLPSLFRKVPDDVFWRAKDGRGNF